MLFMVKQNPSRRHCEHLAKKNGFLLLVVSGWLVVASRPDWNGSFWVSAKKQNRVVSEFTNLYNIVLEGVQPVFTLPKRAYDVIFRG